MDYAKHVSQPTQREPILGRTDMVKNPEGGYVFTLSDEQRFIRFLILGNEGGTYYQSEKELTIENAATLMRALSDDAAGERAVAEIVRVSESGLAPKNDPAIFALALASVNGKEATKRAVYRALPKVCRTGTHLFTFAATREKLKGGWGKGLQRAVERWYCERPIPSLVNQALKYQQRGGWSHRDLLRLVHPETDDEKRKLVFDAICRPEKWGLVDDPLASGYVRIHQTDDAKEAARLIEEYNLPREVVPTQFLNYPAVWSALLKRMPVNALVRNLGNLSKNGVVTLFSDGAKRACEILTDAESVKRSRIHPFAILLAARVYGAGKGEKGSGTWMAVPQVMEALDAAFDLAFGNVTPTGKNFVLGVDVSASMSWPQHVRSGMMASEAAAAMALITARVEPNYFVGGFSHEFRNLGITAKDTIASVMAKTRGLTHGGTDTAVAIRHALANNIPAEVFVIYTDAETWAGDMHTCMALEAYRRTTGIPAKLIVVAFTATGRTVADKSDPLSLDLVGLDASLPQLVSTFASL